MLLSRNITELLNKQMTHEGENHLKYMAMASLCSKHNLVGFEKMFKGQANGERTHYDKVYSYMSDKNAQIEVGTLNSVNYKPTGDCLADMQALAQKFYDLEVSTTKALYVIYQEALDEGDFGTTSFLSDHLIPEQVEEEAMALNIKSELSRCENYGDVNNMDARLK